MVSTHNAGGVDGEDREAACLPGHPGAGVVVATAADEVGVHPARAEERHPAVERPVRGEDELVLEGQPPHSQAEEEDGQHQLGQADQQAVLGVAQHAGQELAGN